MPQNSANEPYYERVSIHEAVKFQQLAKRLQKIDTSEVLSINSTEGERWYIEIRFRDNTTLMISKNLPTFFGEDYTDIPDDRNELFFGIIKS